MIFKIWAGILAAILLLCLVLAGSILIEIKSSAPSDAMGFAGIAMIYPMLIGGIDLLVLLISFLIHWLIWGEK